MAQKAQLKIDSDMYVLSLIKEKKKTLFGKFDQSLTRQDKQNAWRELFLACKAAGIQYKSWEYLRDTAWNNLKKPTIQKFDKARQTGGEGNVWSRLSERDKLVAEILGKDSEYLNGIDVPESFEDEPDPSSVAPPVGDDFDEQISFELLSRKGAAAEQQPVSSASVSTDGPSAASSSSVQVLGKKPQFLQPRRAAKGVLTVNRLFNM